MSARGTRGPRSREPAPPPPPAGRGGAGGSPAGVRPRRRGGGGLVGNSGAGPAEAPPLGPAPSLALLLAAAEVAGDRGRVLVGGRDGRIRRPEERDHGVAE